MQDDTDCAMVGYQQAYDSGKGFAVEQRWYKLIKRAAEGDLVAVEKALRSRRLDQHDKSVREMRASGHLNRINLARTREPCAFPSIRRTEYQNWLEVQKEIERVNA
ncbi:hypothetical protein [Bradyrhizobium arachidis]|uniref:hypothetical protein n=1 Tax=Bradyrhizobium arachidis TaxID=858423 RepID=UPI002161DC0D|nr:hypothetical protein [Bradyrhizobium arachidis]UVO28344.1 hypothetical protein KUF59_38780 [Bradyrhizobium arachidis]